MASNKPVIHARDHLPGGADPLPITYQPIFGQRYIICSNSNPESWRTWEGAATPGGIDGTGNDEIDFDSYVTNDDGTIFWNTGYGLDTGASASRVHFKANGLHGVFASCEWEGFGKTAISYGIIASVGGAARYLSHDLNFQGRHWKNFSRTGATDQDYGTYDFATLDELWCVIASADLYASAVLRSDHDSSADIVTPTNTFRRARLAVVYLGVVGMYPGTYPQ